MGEAQEPDEEVVTVATKSEKAALVDEIAVLMKSASISIVSGYKDLSVADQQELRSRVREAGATFRVVKNSLAMRAAGDAEMDGLGVQTSVGVGILVGETSMSANLTQTTAGIYISGSAAAEMSANFTETSAAIKVLGTTQELDFSANFTQTTAGVGTFVGVSSQNINFTQTSVGDLLFTEISPSVTVTWTEVTHTGDSWTEITHTGDTWTDKTV